MNVDQKISYAIEHTINPSEEASKGQPSWFLDRNLVKAEYCGKENSVSVLWTPGTGKSKDGAGFVQKIFFDN